MLSKSTLVLGGSTSRKAAGTRGEPRTHMPFLQAVVKKAIAPGAAATLAPQPYPALPPGATKQPESRLLYKDAQCIIANDAFPKSRVHCLVMPTDLTLTSLNSLRATHIPLLEHMNKVAEDYIAFLRRSPQSKPSVYGRYRFICGFHSLPSLPMLHMHLMSLDLDSPCLKTKKHYNSFATFFFLTSDRVLEDLRRNGRITLNQDTDRLHGMENQPMKCLWCGTALANMPAVRAHLAECKDNRSLLDSASPVSHAKGGSQPSSRNNSVSSTATSAASGMSSSEK